MISVDTSDVTRGIDKLAQLMPKDLDRVNREVSGILEKTARRKHRYKRKSGSLENATLAKVLDDGVELYIDDAQAPYGEYVHDGTRRWAPDKFIDQAMAANEDRIRKMYEKAIDSAISSAGF